MKKTPLTLALGSLFLTPAIVILMALTTVMALLCWPFMPVLVYLKEKQELANRKP